MNVMTPVVAPETVGMSSERLGRIPEFFKAYVDNKKVSGLSVLVARKGEKVHHSCVGVKDWDTGEAIEEDTIFRIYSMTKAITSVALMMLYEEGKFRLEHDVSRYIPEFRDLRVFDGGSVDVWQTRKPERPMQILDLLTHTSGLTYGFMAQDTIDALYRRNKIGVLDKSSKEAVDLQGFVEKLGKLPLVFDPGSQWNYSVATDVCGHLVEVLSGMSLDEFFRTRIFEPLGMVDTGFFVPDDKLHRFATCYERPAGKKEIVLQDKPETSLYRTSPKFLSGGGGLVSTSNDYFRFIQMVLNGGELGGARLLSPTTVYSMRQNHLPGGQTIKDMGISSFSEEREEGTGFGLGFSVVTDPVATHAPTSMGTFSWGGAASTYFWIDPVEEIVAVFMTQLMPSSTFPMRPQLQTLVNASIIESFA
jgi:CubicO group peptidase (beta-lactamase class C family)